MLRRFCRILQDAAPERTATQRNASGVNEPLVSQASRSVGELSINLRNDLLYVDSK